MALSNIRIVFPLLLTVALLSAGAAHTRKHLRAEGPTGLPDSTSLYLPNADYVRVLSLGHENVLADIFWFQTINYFGKQTRAHGELLWFGHMCDLVTTLDPKALHAYEFCSTLLSWVAKQPEKSEMLLTRAAEQFPDYWRIRYLRAFNRWYFLEQKELAAEEMRIAASLPDAPLFLSGLASRLLVDKSSPDVAIEFLHEMLRKTKNEDARRELTDKLKRAHMARDFAILRDAATLHHQRFGRYPTNPVELVDARIINITPKEPFGGEYRFDADGNPVSSSGEKPLSFAGKTAATGMLQNEFGGN